MSMPRLRIAIDGPAGAGKSTVAKAVAHELGILYVDTGSMYRAIAWLFLHHQAHQASTSVDDIDSLLDRDPLHFERSSDETVAVIWRGQEISGQLRSEAVSNIVSQLSTNAVIRSKLTYIQRDFGRRHSVVMDGRDIGTVVLPDAELKVFLTADLKTRAERRAKELQSQGLPASTADIEQSIAARDKRDSQREIAPLIQADDAHLIDTSGLSIHQVVERIVDLARHLQSKTATKPGQR